MKPDFCSNNKNTYLFQLQMYHNLMHQHWIKQFWLFGYSYLRKCIFSLPFLYEISMYYDNWYLLSIKKTYIAYLSPMRSYMTFSYRWGYCLFDFFIIHVLVIFISKCLKTISNIYNTIGTAVIKFYFEMFVLRITLKFVNRHVYLMNLRQWYTFFVGTVWRCIFHKQCYLDSHIKSHHYMCFPSRLMIFY